MRSFLGLLRRRLCPRALAPRLVAVLLLAISPMLVMLLAIAAAEGQRVVQAAGERALAAARLAAERQDDMLKEAASVMRVLARVPALRDARPGCDDLLRDAIADDPHLLALALIHPDGSVACGSRPGAAGIDASDRPYVQAALRQDGATLVLSSLTLTRANQRPALFAAMPVFGGQRRTGVLVAALDLAWFAKLEAQAGAALVQVLDARDGGVLTRGADGMAEISGPGVSHPVLDAARHTASGVVAATDPDGVRRLFAYAPLPGWGGALLVSVGLSEAEVRSAADRHTALAVLTAAVSAAFVLVVVIMAARRTLVRPVRAIAEAARQMGAGDLSTRPALDRAAAHELRALAGAFVRMARRLRERDARIAGMSWQLARSEEHHRLLADTATDMIARLDPAFRHQYASPASHDLLGLAPEALEGQHLSAIVAPGEWTAVEASLVVPLLDGRPGASGTFRARRADGCAVWVECQGRRLADGSGYVLVSRDVSARKALEAELEAANRQLRVLVRQDGLTGLGNRRHFDDVLGTEYRRALRTGAPLALIMADVDRFKAFNDRYGHPAGDACLQAVAAALSGTLRRPADQAARYGGEEFAILLPATDEGGAAVAALRIQEAVRTAAIPHAESEFGVVTLSLGVAVLQPKDGGQGPAALIEQADAALYAAKRGGRNAIGGLAALV